MKVEIINKSNNPLPEYATTQSAGLDLRAFLATPVTLQPGEHQLIKTGLHIALPEGYEAQIRPRSGLAFKHGITVLNAPGTIDADYRGEIGVLLINLSSKPYTIESGDRICQMVIAPYARVHFELQSKLEKSERGAGGFGSTGKQ